MRKAKKTKMKVINSFFSSSYCFNGNEKISSGLEKEEAKIYIFILTPTLLICSEELENKFFSSLSHSHSHSVFFFFLKCVING
jgi:hypothetical protein